jgi:arylsulfatase A-like enzyme
MIQQDRWRLSKYATGEQLLFDLAEDPQEQHNRIDDAGLTTLRHDLDGRLTSAIMSMMVEAHAVQRVYTATLSSSPAFGREGWTWQYPRPLTE